MKVQKAKKSLNFVSICAFVLLSSFSLTSVAQNQNFPLFSAQMEKFCQQNIYDCKDNGIVSPYKLNTFLRDFYLQVEMEFKNVGFQDANFEYCQFQGGGSYGYYRNSGCLAEGITVKNSSNPLSKVFPKRDKYFAAFGGVNKNLGVHFSRELTPEVADKTCSLRVRSGNEISRKANKAIVSRQIEKISQIRKRFYKKSKILFIQYLPTIWELTPDSKLPRAECWLKDKKEKNIVFEVQEDFI